jgi:D-alanine-D-alanine ligase-like ATP-grasp enzyme
MLHAPEALAALSTCDVAFPLVHGTYGEDGTLQGFLEIAGIPYAGCGVAASAIGMDKALMKALFREAGIPVTRYSVIRSWEYTLAQNDSMALIEEAIGYPCFVKPANGGSSVGVTRARSREDLPHAFKAAFAYDDKAVVEQAVVGREIECSVLGNEQPRGRNAGSTFKNPPESPAWKLIESVGMRGMKRGEAAISDKHCNFFVNEGNAAAADVAWLIAEAQRRVKEQFGVTLEREVEFVGAW